MTNELYILFQQTAAAAWLALVAGVWFFKLKDARQIDRYIGMGCVLISPYLLTCFGVRSVNVAENIEAIAQIQQASPVSVEPRAQLASVSISTKGGNYVEFYESGGWSVRGAGGGDHGFSDGKSGSLPAVLRRSRRELSPVGFAGPEDAAAGREPLSMQATDEPEASSSCWRSRRSDVTGGCDSQSGDGLHRIDQSVQGIEPGTEG